MRVTAHMPLARQVDIVFQQIRDELSFISSGIVFLHIRNNVVGKFGIRHDPIPSQRDDGSATRGLSEQEIYAFRKMAIQSLKHKRTWTHGEILFEFSIKDNMLTTTVQFESSYNMAHLKAGVRVRS